MGSLALKLRLSMIRSATRVWMVSNRLIWACVLASLSSILWVIVEVASNERLTLFFKAAIFFCMIFSFSASCCSRCRSSSARIRCVRFSSSSNLWLTRTYTCSELEFIMSEGVLRLSSMLSGETLRIVKSKSSRSVFSSTLAFFILRDDRRLALLIVFIHITPG